MSVFPLPLAAEDEEAVVAQLSELLGPGKKIYGKSALNRAAVEYVCKGICAQGEGTSVPLTVATILPHRCDLDRTGCLLGDLLLCHHCLQEGTELTH